MAKDDDRFGLPEWAMAGYEEMPVTVWAFSIAVFGLIVIALWRWSGTALPPTAVVDKKYIGEALAESAPRNGNRPEGAKFVGQFRIASDTMYTGPPYFETVAVRTFFLESLIVIFCGFMIFNWGVISLQWLHEKYIAFPLTFIGLAALCFLAAFVVGAIRQINEFMLSQTGALPVVDDQGRPQFFYLGDVPPFLWQYSPWFRTATWALVTTSSLFSALLGSFAADQLIANAYVPGFLAILFLRWLISSIPKRLFRNETQG